MLRLITAQTRILQKTIIGCFGTRTNVVAFILIVASTDVVSGSLFAETCLDCLLSWFLDFRCGAYNYDCQNHKKLNALLYLHSYLYYNLIALCSF